MKSIFFILCLLVATIHIYSTNKCKPKLPISEIEIVAIDTLEFINFWDSFRSAVLNRDTIALTLMIEDEVIGDCFLQVPDLHERGDDWLMFSNKKLTKSQLITLWDRLFTDTYVALMEKYNLKEDLQTGIMSFTNRKIALNIEDIYTCVIPFANRLYRSSISLNTDEVGYRMGFSTGDYNMTASTGIKLFFRKKDKEPIKLYMIDCSGVLISAYNVSTQGKQVELQYTKMGGFRDFYMGHQEY